MNKPTRIFAVLSIFFIMFVGCSEIQPTISTKTASVSPEEINTSILQTRNLSPTPTLMIPSVTKTKPFTTPSVPKITINEVEELLQYDGDCRLPCWWGIKPGKTIQENAEQELTSHGITLIGSRSPKNGVSIDTYGFDLYNPDLVYGDIEINSSNELIQTIQVKAGSNYEESFWGIWQVFNPGNLAANYDPSQILIDIDSQYPSRETGNVIYRLMFLFEQNQTSVEYRGLSKEIDNSYKICPSFLNGGNLTPSLTIFIGDFENDDGDFLALDEVEGESLENIVQGLRSSEDYCLTVARSFWP